MINYYNLHNFVTISVQGDKVGREFIENQLRYFISEKTENSNIKIMLGNFDEKALISKYVIIDRKYNVSNEVIFAHDSYKVAKWKVAICGMYSDCTELYFCGNFWAYYIFFSIFVEPLISLKLNQKNCIMVHSSAASLPKADGLAFFASPSVGKTSTMLNVLEDGGKFISDDFVIMNNERILAYPTPLNLHDHTLNRLTFLKNRIRLIDKYMISFKSLLWTMSFGYADLSHKVHIIDMYDTSIIKESDKYSKIVLLTKSSTKAVYSHKLTTEDAYAKILAINYNEFDYFTKYVVAFGYANGIDENFFWNKMRKNIIEIVQDIEVIEIFVPMLYTDITYAQIMNAITPPPPNL